jgi:hypothetical protein
VASWETFRFGLPIGRLRPSRSIGEMVANADCRKYGDALRTTLDCTPKLVERLEARLRIAEQTRVARFGLHQQRAVIADAQRPCSLRRRRRRGLYSSSSVEIAVRNGTCPSAPAPGHVIGSAPVVIAPRHPENAAGQIRPPSPASQTPRVSQAVPRRCCTRTRSAKPVMKASSAPTVGIRR